ncbi:hypothetical protein ACFQL7_06230 [Halocatena marina]|uniref:Uncharacterized protein n=2 Tax=Halocatena marina TaxID=2934937 RepID=A0ABD5YJS8_9EURY
MPRDVRLTPVHKDLSSKLEVDAWKPFTEVMNVGKPLAKITWGPVMDEYYDEMQEVVYGQKKPMKAGADLHSRLKDLETEV